MCRSIKNLYNFEPEATEEEVNAAALQFVRKISGFTKPSKANEAAFHLAVSEIANAAEKLLNNLVTNAEPKNREIEAELKKARYEKRFSGSSVMNFTSNSLKPHPSSATAKFTLS